MKKVKRYNEAGYVTSNDSNSGMKEAYDASQAEAANEAKEAKEAAKDMYDRATAEGARDAGKITESGDQGFGGAGSGRTVTPTAKAAAKNMPKPAPKPAPTVKAETKAEPAPKAASVDETKLSLSDRMKLSRDRARTGSTTDTRSVSQRLRAAFGMKKGGAATKMASGGMTSSASRRADGIAQKGKTRGKMC